MTNGRDSSRIDSDHDWQFKEQSVLTVFVYVFDLWLLTTTSGNFDKVDIISNAYKQ